MAKGLTDGFQRITRLQAKNWRNFKSITLDLQQRAVVVGPNAVGKSNLLDAVRFLAELAGAGGGLASAVDGRGGLSRVRFLNARNHNRGRVTLAIWIGDDLNPEEWHYELQFTGDSSARRPLVSSEVVVHNGEVVLERPDDADESDPELRTQTALEQVSRNQPFRDVSDFLEGVRYLHLVPQLIRDPGRAQPLAGDPFGTDFLDQIARTPSRERDARLGRMREALRIAIPQLDALDLERDHSGRPHLVARYKHWRPNGARQDERDFSDGTLRLLGLLWSLQETGSGPAVVLLEEPELSLHGEIGARLPAMFARAQAQGGGQLIVSTHSADLLSDEGLGLDEVVLLLPSDEGTTGSLLSDDELAPDVESGALTVADAVRSRTSPELIGNLTSAI